MSARRASRFAFDPRISAIPANAASTSFSVSGSPAVGDSPMSSCATSPRSACRWYDAPMSPSPRPERSRSTSESALHPTLRTRSSLRGNGVPANSRAAMTTSASSSVAKYVPRTAIFSSFFVVARTASAVTPQSANGALMCPLSCGATYASRVPDSMARRRAFTPEQLRRIVEAAVPGARPLAAEPLAGGIDTATYVLRTTAGSFVARVYRDHHGDAAWAVRNGHAMLAAASAATPLAPRPVFSDPEGSVIGEPLVVATYVEGAPL